MNLYYNRYIGIDVSKKTIDIAVLDSGSSTFKHARLSNDDSGYTKMIQYIKEDHTPANNKLLFCLENTGLYSLPLTHFLSKMQFDYTVLHGPVIKQFTGTLNRGKSDKLDACRLAEFAYRHSDKLKLAFPVSDNLLKLKALLAYRDRLTKSKVALQNSIKELKGFTESHVSSKIIQDSSKQIKELRAFIKKVDKEMVGLIYSDSKLGRTFDLMLSVTGVGVVIAANIIVYTNCFTSFTSWRKFACYCGLAPFEYSSGTSIRRKTRTSKMANRKLKALIGNGASSALLVDKELSMYYERKLKEGKHKLLAMNNVKNKIISRIFATVKRGTPYVKLNMFAVN